MDVSSSVRARFTDLTGRAPAVVARGPGRVNLIGEHTDYNGGRCLPFAIDRATWVAAGPRTDDRVRVVSAQAGTWEGADPRAATGWAAYAAGVVWALRADGVDIPGVDLVVDSDLPLGAGLASSASLGCAVAVSLCPDLGPDRLAAACVRAETEVAGAPTGGMDQAVVLRARAGHALLLDFGLDVGLGFGTDSARHVRLDPGADGVALLVIDTGVRHALADGEYAERRLDCEAAAAALGAPLPEASVEDLSRIEDPGLRRRAMHVVTECARVDAVVELVAAGDWPGVGRVLDASHASLRDDFEVSCPELDTAVAAAREAGALGARMTGGGFGGSAVALVPQGSVGVVGSAVVRAAARAGLRSPTVHRVWPAAGAARTP